MPHGSPSGVRLLVRQGGGVIVALPVPRQACLGLARAVLAATTSGPEGESRPDAESDPALGLLATALGSPLDSQRCHAAAAAWLRLPSRPAGGGLDAEASFACWLSLQTAPHSPLSGIAPGRGDGHAAAESRWERIHPSAPPGDGTLLDRLAADIFSGDAPEGVLDGGEAGWEEGNDGRPPAVGDAIGVRALTLLERLRGFSMPSARGTPPGPVNAEGAMLIAAMRAAVAHRRLASGFEDALGEARLDAIRELAYGAGHEINNPLANIATRAQTLLLGERDPERRRRLSTIVDQAFRARDLIGGLMLFARPPRPQRVVVDVHRLVAAVVDGARPVALQRRARLEYSPSPGAVEVSVDRAQVEEALRAVISNALEAVGDGGRVTVAVAATGAACEILVSDDGRGMDAATLRRAFDPFFSGREAGRGVGLGLSKAWRFLGANGGDIEIESRSGLGTRVRISLPVARPASAIPENDRKQEPASLAVYAALPKGGVKVDATIPG